MFKNILFPFYINMFNINGAISLTLFYILLLFNFMSKPIFVSLKDPNKGTQNIVTMC